MGLLSGDLSIMHPGGLNFPEGVAADAAGWLWAGGADGEIYRFTAVDRPAPFLKLTGRMLGIVPCSYGGVTICAQGMKCIVRVDDKGNWWTVGPDDIPFANFAAYDLDGRLYVTNSGAWDQPTGSIIRVDGDGSWTVEAEGLAFPNGIAFDSSYE